MFQVSDILASKGSAVFTVQHDTLVLDAIRLMVERNVGAIVVLQGDAVFGIFTERDYLRRIVLEGRTSGTTRVSEVATERLVCVDPGRDVEDCMSLMTQERVRHLPVIDGGRLAGIVSIGDLVKHLSRERAAEVRYLTDYIAGKYPA